MCATLPEYNVPRRKETANMKIVLNQKFCEIFLLNYSHTFSYIWLIFAKLIRGHWKLPENVWLYAEICYLFREIGIFRESIAIFVENLAVFDQ